MTVRRPTRQVDRTCIRTCCRPNARAWRASWRTSGASWREYEALKQGAVSSIAIDSFDDLGLGLIKARIAAGLSQKALAKRLGIKEQQIQRYESERYVSASYRRLQEIVRALGVSITKEIRLAGSGGAQAVSTSDPLTKKA